MIYLFICLFVPLVCQCAKVINKSDMQFAHVLCRTSDAINLLCHHVTSYDFITCRHFLSVTSSTDECTYSVLLGSVADRLLDNGPMGRVKGISEVYCNVLLQGVNSSIQHRSKKETKVTVQYSLNTSEPWEETVG